MFDKFIVEITDDGRVKLRCIMSYIGYEGEPSFYTMAELPYFIEIWNRKGGLPDDMIVEMETALELLENA